MNKPALWAIGLFLVMFALARYFTPDVRFVWLALILFAALVALLMLRDFVRRAVRKMRRKMRGPTAPR
jgi:hypothetical protein